MNQPLRSSEANLHFDNNIDDAASWLEHIKSDEGFSEVGIMGMTKVR